MLHPERICVIQLLACLCLCLCLYLRLAGPAQLGNANQEYKYIRQTASLLPSPSSSPALKLERVY